MDIVRTASLDKTSTLTPTTSDNTTTKELTIKSENNDNTEVVEDQDNEFFGIVNISLDDSSSPLEIPLQSDGSISLSVLTSYFPDCCGVAKKNPDTGALSVAKKTSTKGDWKLWPVRGRLTWGDDIYVCVMPQISNKRRRDEDNEEEEDVRHKIKRERLDDNKNVLPTSKDVKVLESFNFAKNFNPMYLPPTELVSNVLCIRDLVHPLTDDDIVEYFSRFGHVRTLRWPSRSKTGRIFFSSSASTPSAIGSHVIKGLDVCAFPSTSSKTYKEDNEKRTAVVRGVPSDLSAKDLEDNLKDFGPISYIYMPNPRNLHAFVQFKYGSDRDEAVIDKFIEIDYARMSLVAWSSQR